jgi:phosphoribosylanthranilate isomerase
LTVAVKICGLTDPVGLDAALTAGAHWVGFVFYPPSPRHLTSERAAALTAQVQGRALTVGLFVDPSDDELAATLGAVALDLVQLHGAEDPKRVAEIKSRFQRPIIKALGVQEPSDLLIAADYEPMSDLLLFDAKPPKTSDALPGGNGLSYDWSLCRGAVLSRPWLLSGGLTAENVQVAIKSAGAQSVDVSSGVERARGVKDPALIERFIAAAQGGIDCQAS